MSPALLLDIADTAAKHQSSALAHATLRVAERRTRNRANVEYEWKSPEAKDGEGEEAQEARSAHGGNGRTRGGGLSDRRPQADRAAGGRITRPRKPSIEGRSEQGIRSGRMAEVKSVFGEAIRET